MTDILKPTPEVSSLPLSEAAESQPLVMADFGEYRTWCDARTNNFRRTGILGEESYTAAVADPETLWCEMGGVAYPLSTPVEHEPMYKPDRAKAMAGIDRLHLLAAPVQSLASGEVTVLPASINRNHGRDIALIVEEFDDTLGQAGDRLAERNVMAGVLHDLGRLSAHDFINPTLMESKGHETSWMSIYSLGITPKNEPALPLGETEVPEETLSQAWQQYRQEHGLPEYPGEDFEGTFLFTGKQLATDHKLIDGLWGISQKGFGEVLGAYHPISMEVTREFFDQQLMADDMQVMVRFHNGKPVCFGSVALNLEHNDWINVDSSLVQREVEAANGNQEIMAHFFEIISNGDEGLSFSPDVLNLFLELAGRTKHAYHVLFESTNLSALYIPMIATRQSKRSEYISISHPVTQLGKLDYWYLKTEDPSLAE